MLPMGHNQSTEVLPLCITTSVCQFFSPTFEIYYILDIPVVNLPWFGKCDLETETAIYLFTLKHELLDKFPITWNI